MFKYIRADLYRIFHQVFRYIWLILCLVIMVALQIHFAMKDNLNALGFAASIHVYVVIASIICGIGELSAVFTDDFRAKTMQIAIGSGVSRRHVVLAKLLEVTFLLLVDLLLLVLLMFLSGVVVMGLSFTAHPIQQMLAEVLAALLRIVLCCDVTMILLFYTQKSGFAPLLFLVLYWDPINILFKTFFSTNETFQRLHLGDYTMDALAGTISTQLGLGASFPAMQLIVMLAYIAVVYLLVCLVFKKRELDF